MQEQKTAGNGKGTARAKEPLLRTKLAALRERLSAARNGVDAKQVGSFLLTAGAAFLLGQCTLGFGAYPLGIAFLAAIPGNLLPALAGACGAALFAGAHPAILITVCTAAALIRAVGKFLTGRADDLPRAKKVPSDGKLSLLQQFRAVTRIGIPADGTDGTDAGSPGLSGTGAGKNASAGEPANAQGGNRSGKDGRASAGGNAAKVTGEAERSADAGSDTGRTDSVSGTPAGGSGAAGAVAGATAEQTVPGDMAEPLALRMVAAAVAATAAGVAVCVAGGFRVYDLIGMGISVAAATLAVPVIASAADPEVKNMVPGKIATAILVFLLLFSARDLTLFGIRVGIAGGFFFTADTVRRRGVVAGLIASVIAGLAYQPALTPVFVLCAISVSLLGGVSRSVSLVVGAAAATAYGVVTGGLTGALTVLPGSLTGAVAAEAAARFSSMKKSAGGAGRSPNEPDAEDATLVRLCRGDAVESHLRDLSGAFSSLSEMFFNLSDRIRRPALLDLRHACDAIMEKNCDGCPDRDICWGLSYETTMDALGKITSSLYKKGVADAERIDGELRARCQRMDTILSEMNEACARMTGEALRGCRTEIFAFDYEALAGILSEALENDRQSYECDPALGKKIAAALSGTGLTVDGVAAFGGGRRRVLARGVDLLHAETDAKAVQTAVERACGIRMSRPVFEVSDGESVMYMNARRRFSIRHAERTVPAKDEGCVCGDAVSAFAGKNDRFCALICDGMGRGKEAALTAGISCVFLEKMLSAGNRAATSVRMLNTFVRSGGACVGECSATVDLCEIDLFTGSASFLKSGAAPSFVVRAGKAFRLAARTLPVGILGSVDAQAIRFDLLAGDLIVMMSDGVSDALAEKLPDILKVLPAGPDRAAEELLARVRGEVGDEADDLSVIVMAVIPAADEEE